MPKSGNLVRNTIRCAIITYDIDRELTFKREIIIILLIHANIYPYISVLF